MAPRALGHAALLRRAAEDGHEIGLHCVRHVRHDRMTREGILSDASDGLRALRDLGHEARLWRTPWGVVTGDTVAVARGLGLRLAGWTADTEDWRGGSSGAMLARVRPDLAEGVVILAHDGLGPGADREGCAGTVALVGPLVALLRSRGLEPGPLGDLRGPLPDRNPGAVSRV